MLCFAVLREPTYRKVQLKLRTLLKCLLRDLSKTSTITRKQELRRRHSTPNIEIED